MFSNSTWRMMFYICTGFGIYDLVVGENLLAVINFTAALLILLNIKEERNNG